MAVSIPITGHVVDIKYLLYLFGLLLIFVVTISRWVFNYRPDPLFPVVTVERHSIIEQFLPTKFFWMKDAHGLVAKGLADFNGPFQVLSGNGYKIVLPNRYADELRNSPDLNFNENVARDFCVNYPGFDAFTEGTRDATFWQEVVRVKLTQSLGLITDDLVEETDASLHDVFGEFSDYRSVPIKQNMLDVVARLSSRALLGLPLCRDPDWLDIAKNHTVDLFLSAQLMRLPPSVFRPLVYWIIPSCTRLRKQVRSARRLIMREVETRRERAQKALDAGQKPAKQADAIAWMVEVAQSQGRQPDYVAGQLTLSMAAIHTTSETMLNCVLQLCETPSLVKELRKEIIQVLTTEGWSKQTLYKLRFMDSFLRETQRVRAMAITSMGRLVTKDMTLSDGTFLRKGSRIMVHDHKLDNAPNPTDYDPHRYLRLRGQPGEENKHQFATLNSNHMGFGYGNHACPGRFFASNELKILLCFLLLKYEFRYAKGGKGEDEELIPKYFTFEVSKMADPNCRIEIRRRREEIDILQPKVPAS